MNDQKSAIKEALKLTEEVWAEMLRGHYEDILQDAVYLQINVNRIVWKLNERLKDETAMLKGEKT